MDPKNYSCCVLCFPDNLNLSSNLILHKTNKICDVIADEVVWTDARYISKQWIWFHSGQLINDIDFNDITSSHPRTHTCGIAHIGTDDNGDVIDEMREVLCDEDRRPLCEAPKF